MDLKTFFDRVVVINLKRRADRMISFRKEISEKGWPFAEPVVFEAIDGSIVPSPIGWVKGSGTWGNCLPGNAVQGKILSALKVRYAGESVEIVTRSGQATTLTVNHPVLTEHGFVAAGSLKQGANLLCYHAGISGSQQISPDHHEKNCPSLIEQVFDAFRKTVSMAGSKVVSTLDFYGDGKFLKGEIEIVDADGFLRACRNANFRKGQSQDSFRRSDVRHTALAQLRANHKGVGDVPPAFLDAYPSPSRYSSGLQVANRHASIAENFLDSAVRMTAAEAELSAQVEHGFTGLVASRDFRFNRFGRLAVLNDRGVLESKSFGKSSRGYAEFSSQIAKRFASDMPRNQQIDVANVESLPLGAGAELDAGFGQPAFQSLGVELRLVRELLKGFPGKITLDPIVEIRRFHYDGPCYDLKTSDGYFVSNSRPMVNGGIVVANCLQSHRQVLERAIMDGVKSLLVLEDDLCMRSSFVKDAESFFAVAPEDWDQLMLGGQHIHSPRQYKPGVVRCTNCQRTHAYAIRGRMLKDLYAIWCSHTSQTHCDHIMGPVQSRYNVYAPDPFLFGQNRSESDISRALNPKKFWVSPTGQEPVYLLRCSLEIVRGLRDYGVHTGYMRNLITDVDMGLDKAFTSPQVEAPLRKWIRDLQDECVSEEGMVLGLWHPKATPEIIAKCWTGPCILVEATTLDDALAAIPNLKRRGNVAGRLVVLLRADKAVAGQLRDLGWHFGNWRDPVTDLDNGLREWSETKDASRLREIVRVLSGEAQVRPRAVTCLRHPDLTVEHVAAVTDLKVLEIVAETSEDALRQLQAHLEGSTAVASSKGE